MKTRYTAIINFTNPTRRLCKIIIISFFPRSLFPIRTNLSNNISVRYLLETDIDLWPQFLYPQSIYAILWIKSWRLRCRCNIHIDPIENVICFRFWAERGSWWFYNGVYFFITQNNHTVSDFLANSIYFREIIFRFSRKFFMSRGKPPTHYVNPLKTEF